MFDEFYREMAWVICLFDVVVLNVGDHPKVSWVFAFGVTLIFAGFGTLEIFLAWILLRYSYGIKVKDIIVSLCEPSDGFVSSGKTPAAMQAVLKVPNDSIAYF